MNGTLILPYGAHTSTSMEVPAPLGRITLTKDILTRKTSFPGMNFIHSHQSLLGWWGNEKSSRFLMLPSMTTPLPPICRVSPKGRCWAIPHFQSPNSQPCSGQGLSGAIPACRWNYSSSRAIHQAYFILAKTIDGKNWSINYQNYHT